MTEPTPLIPREVLFGNPERTSPKLSPDGQYLAYIAPDKKNILQVWLRNIGQENDRIITTDKKRGIRNFFWTYKPSQLIYLQDAGGDENFHLYQVDVLSQIVRDLTPFQGVKAQLVEIDHNFPDCLLVELNLQNAKAFDVYRINLETGAVELDTKNPGNYKDWTADNHMQIRAAIAKSSDGGSELVYRETPEEPWESLRHWGPDEIGEPLFFSIDDQTLYINSNQEVNALQLLALNLSNRKESRIAADPKYDISTTLTHPTTKAIEAVGFYKEILQWQILDPAIAADFEFLRKVRPGEFRIADRTLDNTSWLVVYTTDDGPAYYYIYYRSTKTVMFLFVDKPTLEEAQLASMEPISYDARDGLTIHGYLTKPLNVSTPVPAILLVHGGPWNRDTWGYSPYSQWLANRGYAVLQVNFRGSGGYGKDFLNAGNREWGGKMQEDLLDAVDWLVQQDIAPRNEIAIMGASYGGYATLAGLTFSPEVFAAGVDIVGPSSLVTLLKTLPPYWEAERNEMYHRVGNLETEEEFLKSRSPLFFVDKIEKPLLISQGANDPRVKEAESEQIFKAMKDAGKPVEYVVYTDEGHGFARPENRLHFFAIAEKFLSKHLGGRFEPLGEIEGHSGVVSAG